MSVPGSQAGGARGQWEPIFHRVPTSGSRSLRGKVGTVSPVQRLRPRRPLSPGVASTVDGTGRDAGCGRDLGLDGRGLGLEGAHGALGEPAVRAVRNEKVQVDGLQRAEDEGQASFSGAPTPRQQQPSTPIPPLLETRGGQKRRRKGPDPPHPSPKSAASASRRGRKKRSVCGQHRQPLGNS